jgi:hypothetical protein
MDPVCRHTNQTMLIEGPEITIRQIVARAPTRDNAR